MNKNVSVVDRYLLFCVIIFKKHITCLCLWLKLIKMFLQRCFFVCVCVCVGYDLIDMIYQI